MLKIVFVFALLLYCNTDGLSKTLDKFAVAAYLPEWRYGGANFEKICETVTHLIFFSLEPTPSGAITGLDRFPGPDVLEDARNKGCELIICFGGNGRSSGFSSMTRNDDARVKFVKNVRKLVRKNNLDGVDYNWEYPGYQFGSGYGSDVEVMKDYEGLQRLVQDTRCAMPNKTLSMAYYPDSRQERIILQLGIPSLLDYMHIMSYDQSGEHHSSYEYAVKTLDQGIAMNLPTQQLTLGVPFYGRHSQSGDWSTYEDLVQQYHPLDSGLDKVKLRGRKHGGASIGFNGIDTIRKKTQYAIDRGAGGVMIWEVGQDCRLGEVIRAGQTHVVTCPEGERSSLLVAMRDVISKYTSAWQHSRKSSSVQREEGTGVSSVTAEL